MIKIQVYIHLLYIRPCNKWERERESGGGCSWCCLWFSQL